MKEDLRVLCDIKVFMTFLRDMKCNSQNSVRSFFYEIYMSL